MAYPSFLTIGRITCLATDDTFGGDDLAGMIGADRFTIGHFNAGDGYDVGLRRAITPGADTLVIIEVDATGDDELIRIDLRQDMDLDRIIPILTGSARYDIALHVQSEPDG